MLGPMNRFHLDISAIPDQAEPIRWGVPAWQGLWRGTPLIKIYDVNGCRITIIPIGFLSQGSISEAWQQIIAIIGCCVRSQGGRLYQQGPRGLSPIDESVRLIPGDCIFGIQSTLSLGECNQTTKLIRWCRFRNKAKPRENGFLVSL
jgi:hypothetical protein